MADTRIPLSVNQVDIANPLMILAQRERLAKQDQIAEQDRAMRLEELALEREDRTQARDLRALQMDEIRRRMEQVDPQVRSSAMQSIAVNTMGLRNLMDQGDLEAAELMANQIKATSASIGLPSTEVDNFMNLLRRNPQSASRYLDQQIEALRPSLPQIFQPVTNEQGQMVGQRNMQTNRIEAVPEGMRPQQVDPLEQYIQQLEIENQQLTNDRLRTQNASEQAEQQGAQQRAQEATQARVAGVDSIMEEVDAALRETTDMATGVSGKVTGVVPGTSAYNLARRIETIKANLGFDKLQAMREASPTGGALGSVTERELGYLQATVANLEPGMGEERLTESLQKIKRHYTNWRNAALGITPEQSAQQTPATVGRFQIEVLN